MKKSLSVPEIAAILMPAPRVLVVSHYNPDPDAYGSSCALTLALEEMGKQVACINENGPGARYSFIPGVPRVTSELPAGEWDLLVACDCGDMKRFGDRLIDSLKNFPLIVNIDHHVSNDYFGHHNLVVDSASSTCEIIFDLLGELRHPISEPVAKALLSGISGDTGSFRYSNTSARVFQIAAELTSRGARPYEIAQAIFGTQPLSAVKLQAEALANLATHFSNRCGVAVVSKKQFVKFGATREDTESLVERVRDIEGVEIGVCIREEDDQWKVSLRSKIASRNVSDIAAKFGGGGHVMAAAFRWKRGYEELEKLLLHEIEKALGNAT